MSLRGRSGPDPAQEGTKRLPPRSSRGPKTQALSTSSSWGQRGITRCEVRVLSRRHWLGRTVTVFRSKLTCQAQARQPLGTGTPWAGRGQAGRRHRRHHRSNVPAPATPKDPPAQPGDLIFGYLAGASTHGGPGPSPRPALNEECRHSSAEAGILLAPDSATCSTAGPVPGV